MRLLLSCSAAAKPPLDVLQQAGVICDLSNAQSASVMVGGRSPYDLILLTAETGGAALPALVAIRRDGPAVPAVVLAGSLTDREEEALLEAGADDVLPEATSPARLLARLRATARRLQAPATPAFGNLSVDRVRRISEVAGRHLGLTASEFDLLAALLDRPGKLLTKAACQSALYPGGEPPGSRTVDVFVCRLRRKLADARADAVIRTVWGRGYLVDRRAA